MRKLLVGAAALLAALAAVPVASAATGHADVSYARSDDDAFDTDAYGVGGVVAFDAGALGVQLDFDYTNISVDDVDADADAFGVGAHLYKQTSQWLLGGYAGYNRIEPDGGGDFDAWTVAGEGQWYLARTTLGAAISYSDGEDDFNEWALQGDVKHFYTDNLSVAANLAFGNDDYGAGDDADFWSAGLGGEFQFAQAPVSILAGWQHSDVDGGDESDTFGVGARWNWGGTLFERNRSGGDLQRRTSNVRAFGIT